MSLEKVSWERIDAVFTDALELEPRERSAFVKEACGDDRALFDRVSSLLEVDDQAGDFLSARPDWPQANLELQEDERPNEAPIKDLSIGPYQVIKELGNGGMGTVYLATGKQGDYERQVAVKVLRQGVASSSDVKRFKKEREVLAQLQHPNIAYLLDGGVTDRGLPFLVMEFVDGERIDAYADRHKLDLTRRLELFVTICGAVNYAHQNLIVHRDIKPGNILVSTEGHVKLLDFGIAKVLEEPGKSATATFTSQKIMTPAYASPEQVKSDSITTASDIYQLGLLLYELLTGQRPYTGRTTSEMERAILEDQPQKPSSVVTRTLHAGSATDPSERSLLRGSDTTSLSRRLAGDLDTIVLMALRKEPGRRYSSAGQMAEDIKRHLEGLPIQARKATLGYRMRKFTARNKLAVAAASFVLLSLVAGLGLAMWQARIAGIERDLAEVERTNSQQVTRFLIGMMQSADPQTSRGDTLNVFEVLEQTERRIDDDLSGQPLVRADLHNAYGQIFRRLGNFSKAEDHLARSVELRRAHLTGDAEFAGSLDDLGSLLLAVGEFDKAEEILSEALTLRTELFGRVHEDVANSVKNLAGLNRVRGNFPEAKRLYQEALDIRSEVYGPGHELTAWAKNNLAVAMRDLGQYQEALPLQEAALDEQRVILGPDHPDALSIENHLSLLRREMGKTKVAVQMQESLVERYIEQLGYEHHKVGSQLHNLGVTLHYDGQLEAAETRLLEALDIRTRVLDAGHINIALTNAELASVRVSIGKNELAVGQLESVLKELESQVPDDHVWLSEARATKGRLLVNLNRPVEAKEYLDKASALVEKNLGPDNWRVGLWGAYAGYCDRQTGAEEAGQKRIEEGLSILVDGYGDGYLAETIRNLASGG